MSGLAKYFPHSSSLKAHDGSEVPLSALAGKTVFFYFSASWCPPCRGFTPQLTEFYGKYAAEKKFEVVFVSWDEEEDDHNGYFERMPWISLPFSDRDGAKYLTNTFEVQSIPTLIGVNADNGDVITTQARAKVVTDPEGKDFPWPN